MGLEELVNNMKIQIKVLGDNDEVLAKREALDWESAAENFGKLERQFAEMERMKSCKCGYDIVVGSDDNGGWYCSICHDKLQDT